MPGGSERYSPGGELKRGTVKTGFVFIKKNNGTKWLSDDRNFKVLTPEDAKWGQEVWFPETKKAGWKYWAMIMPEKQVGKMSVKKLIKQYTEAGIKTEVFDNVDKAMEWLEQQ